MSFGKFGGLPTLVAFPENLLARQEQINGFKYTSSLKCPTPWHVKFHKALCVKSDYNRMESFSIGER